MAVWVVVDGGAIHHHVAGAAASLFHGHPEYVERPLAPTIVAYALQNCGVGDGIRHTAQLGHPVEQHVHSLVGPFGVAEASEEGTDNDDVCLHALPEEAAEEGES